MVNTNDMHDQNAFGVFETMRFINGRILLEDYHFERLLNGLDKLKIHKPSSFSIEKISAEITGLCKKNNCFSKARVRLSVVDPFDYFIEVLPLNEISSDERLVIDIFLDVKKKCDEFANLKLINREIYVAAEKFIQENKLDDCLILNEHGRICESTISNIFWIKDDVIYTPPLSEGCVAGVMRRYLMEKIRDTRYGIREKPLLIEELFDADEVFLTNAIRGIRWVKQFKDKDYSNSQTLKIKNEFLQGIFFI